MIQRVDQTSFVPEGNCQSAVLSMLTGIPLGEIPNFYHAGPSELDWWNAYHSFLQKKGWWFISFHNAKQVEHIAKHGKGYYEVAGPSSRGVLHTVVYCNGELWHDPHPSREGVLNVTEVRFYYPIYDAKVFSEDE